MMNVFRHFFCWWPQWQTLGKHCSSEDEFPIHGSLQRGTHTRKGKSTERVTDGENSLSQKRSCYCTNPQLKFSVDGEDLQASIRMVQTMCEPDSSLASPPEEDSGSSHVACSAPRGAQADFSEVLSFDWLGFRLCLWIARPQKAELIFREELQAKEFNSVLYIVQAFWRSFVLKKEKKSRIHIWLKLLDS